MATSAPPLPPEVQSQMAPDPALLFAQNAGAVQPVQQFDPLLFAEDRMNQIAALMKELADVMVVSKPSLMPVLQRIVQGFSLLMNEVQSSKPQPPAPSPEQAQMQGPVDGAGMVSMS